LKALKYRFVLIGLLIVVGMAGIVGVSSAFGSYISGLNIPILRLALLNTTIKEKSRLYVGGMCEIGSFLQGR